METPRIGMRIEESIKYRIHKDGRISSAMQENVTGEIQMDTIPGNFASGLPTFNPNQYRGKAHFQRMSDRHGGLRVKEQCDVSFTGDTAEDVLRQIQEASDHFFAD